MAQHKTSGRSPELNHNHLGGIWKGFFSAFLSEDYWDELVEQVRSRTQGETETIWDFAFTYRALCKHWKPGLTEAELVKRILKNIKPHLACQLCSCINTVEELVKLGHKLEKDYKQLQYGTCVSRQSFPDVPQKRLTELRTNCLLYGAADVKDTTLQETVHTILPVKTSLKIHITSVATKGHFCTLNMYSKSVDQQCCNVCYHT